MPESLSVDTKLSSGRAFTAARLPASARVVAWQPRIVDAIERSPAGGPADAPPERTTRWEIGDLIFTCAVGATARVRSRRPLPPAFPGHWCLTLVRKRRPAGAPGDWPPSLSFGPLAPVLEEYGPRDEVLTLILPRASLPHLERVSGAVLDFDIPAAMRTLLAGYLVGLARHLPAMTGDEVRALAGPTATLVAACVVPSSQPVEAAPTLLATTLIERATDVVRQNMASPDFGPDQLCQLLAMSRSKLYRHFRPFGGVGAFIQQERLRDALVRLADQNAARAVHRIAEDVGFDDHSTFSRAFRRAFGFRPTEARERVLAEPSLLTKLSRHRAGCDDFRAAGDGPGRD
jgi:AraC-like DNA-binding protein